jgi:hypothetical protein
MTEEELDDLCDHHRLAHKSGVRLEHDPERRATKFRFRCPCGEYDEIAYIPDLWLVIYGFIKKTPH